MRSVGRYGWLPILMYHRVAADDRPGAFTVSTGRLRRQLGLLQRRGSTAVSLAEGVGILRRREPGAGGMCITFDDAYLDTYTLAWPILDEFAFRATIFPVVGCVG